MDIKQVGAKALDFVKKYRYAILVLLVGIVLMALPEKAETQAEEQVREEIAAPAPSLTEQLEQVLVQIKGVGKVTVLLTVAEGERNVYQYDEDVSLSDGSSTSRKDTVITTDSDRDQQALIVQVVPAVYQGAVIVCQGADSPAVKLAVTDAVAKATGLSADKISVLKMK